MMYINGIAEDIIKDQLAQLDWYYKRIEDENAYLLEIAKSNSVSAAEYEGMLRSFARLKDDYYTTRSVISHFVNVHSRRKRFFYDIVKDVKSGKHRLEKIDL